VKKIARFLNEVVTWLVSFGAFGLFAIALLDSAFVPLPGGADAVMILLSTANPSRMVFYAVAATLGSTIGCVILYYISQKAGSRALSRFSDEKQRRVRSLIERYDVLAVLVASVLPPPFPFKLFVVSAGVFRFNVVRFAIAVAVGRFFRFIVEGLFAVYFGEQAGAMLARNYPFIGLGVAVMLIGFFVVKNLLKSKKEGGTIRG